MPGDGVVLVLGTAAYVDSFAGEGAGNGDDRLDDRVGGGPGFEDETRGREISFAGSDGDERPVGTCTDELTVAVAGNGLLRRKFFLEGFLMVKLWTKAPT